MLSVCSTFPNVIDTMCVLCINVAKILVITKVLEKSAWPKSNMVFCPLRSLLFIARSVIYELLMCQLSGFYSFYSFLHHSNAWCTLHSVLAIPCSIVYLVTSSYFFICLPSLFNSHHTFSLYVFYSVFPPSNYNNKK